jgi:hypothetical protein
MASYLLPAIISKLNGTILVTYGQKGSVLPAVEMNQDLATMQRFSNSTSFSISPTLPSCLKMNPNSSIEILSGGGVQNNCKSPPVNYTITASVAIKPPYNTIINSTFVFSLAVAPVAPSLTGTCAMSEIKVYANTPLSEGLVFSTCFTGVELEYSISNGIALPQGLAFDSSTSALRGTLTVDVTSPTSVQLLITARNGGGEVNFISSLLLTPLSIAKVCAGSCAYGGAVTELAFVSGQARTYIFVTDPPDILKSLSVTPSIAINGLVVEPPGVSGTPRYRGPSKFSSVFEFTVTDDTGARVAKALYPLSVIPLSPNFMYSNSHPLQTVPSTLYVGLTIPPLSPETAFGGLISSFRPIYLPDGLTVDNATGIISGVILSSYSNTLQASINGTNDSGSFASKLNGN